MMWPFLEGADIYQVSDTGSLECLVLNPNQLV